MDKDFLLQTETAKELYHNHAAKMPIFDYHCHINPKEIAENKQFLENIIDASICGICLFSFEEQKVVRINQRYTDILGYSLSEVKNLDDPISIYHPEDVLDISKHIELVIESESGSRFPIQYRMKHKDGH